MKGSSYYYLNSGLINADVQVPPDIFYKVLSYHDNIEIKYEENKARFYGNGFHTDTTLEYLGRVEFDNECHEQQEEADI